ncbi:MAG: dehypoxanthine futalosine cyclase, partial [Planctomycetes bacterium]|nr:dehypoxanthine futalosine cyclase [Planctomycetota bacterium]
MPETRPQLDAFDRGLLQAVVHGEARLTPEQSLRLLVEMPLAELGFWADQRCRAVHGEAIRTYVIDRNINYTNVCTAKCTFCAFRRDEGDADAYVLPVDRILQKIQ